MDFKLTTGNRNDLDITNGKQSFVSGIDATAQKVAMKLQSFVGESPYDRLGGTPWIKPNNTGQQNNTMYIFENTSDPEMSMRFILTEVVRTVAGVRAVLELAVVLDRATRVAQVTGRVEYDSGGTFTFSTTQTP